MKLFKEENETKRVIFNVRRDLADRLERAKKHSRAVGKKLDADAAVDEALERFLKKAEKKIGELLEKHGIPPDSPNGPDGDGAKPAGGEENEPMENDEEM